MDKNKKKAVFLTQTKMLADILRPADAQVSSCIVVTNLIKIDSHPTVINAKKKSPSHYDVFCVISEV